MKDQRNKRKRVDDEANFIGDVLRLLFALSIVVVTIVAGFILFIYGFTLPNLKETEASVEQTKDAVVITEEVKETKKKEKESIAESTKESTVESAESQKESTTEVAKEKEDKTKESSTTKESKSEKEGKGEKESIGESPTLESKKSKTKESSQGTKGPDNAVIGEGPEIDHGDDEVGPGVVSP